MCLKMVHKQTQAITRGYKIVQRVGYNKYQGLYLPTRFKVGTLHRADRSAKILADCGTFYTSGFHAFTEISKQVRKLAQNKTIVRVELEGITASGRQNGAKCVVAKRMRILGEVKQ